MFESCRCCCKSSPLLCHFSVGAGSNIQASPISRAGMQAYPLVIFELQRSSPAAVSTTSHSVNPDQSWVNNAAEKMRSGHLFSPAASSPLAFTFHLEIGCLRLSVPICLLKRIPCTEFYNSPLPSPPLPLSPAEQIVQFNNLALDQRSSECGTEPVCISGSSLSSLSLSLSRFVFN